MQVTNLNKIAHSSRRFSFRSSKRKITFLPDRFGYFFLCFGANSAMHGFRRTAKIFNILNSLLFSSFVLLFSIRYIIYCIHSNNQAEILFQMLLLACLLLFSVVLFLFLLLILYFRRRIFCPVESREFVEKYS